MKIEGTYTIAAGRERVFALLLDGAVLRRCVPGCKELTRQADDRFDATLEVGVGSVKGVYTGTLTIAEKVAPERLAMAVSGKGKAGFVNGKGTLRLEPIEEAGASATRIVYEGDVQIGGTIATVGQRMLSGAAAMMTGQFFAAIDAEAKAAAAEAPPPRQGALVNLFRWLWALVRGLVGRGG